MHKNMTERLEKEVDLERIILWMRMITTTTAATF